MCDGRYYMLKIMQVDKCPLCICTHVHVALCKDTDNGISFHLLLILMPLLPWSPSISDPFLWVRCCDEDVLRIRAICVFGNLRKDVESLPVHVALIPNGQLNESCKIPSLW